LKVIPTANNQSWCAIQYTSAVTTPTAIISYMIARG
jgi:hypothetical protein